MLAAAKNHSGATLIFAVNVLGHAALVDALIDRQLITSTIVYAGSEAARGLPKMGVEKPKLQNHSQDEFFAIASGDKFGADDNPLEVYGAVKLIATLWMGEMARKHPHLRFVTMSPGGTAGTSGMDDLPFFQRIMFKHIGGTLMPLLGMMHSLETGGRRMVDGVLNPAFETGNFYASRAGWPTGPLVNQLSFDAIFDDAEAQHNAHQAIHKFV